VGFLVCGGGGGGIFGELAVADEVGVGCVAGVERALALSAGVAGVFHRAAGIIWVG
jgi:hypothetical protein